MKHPLDLLLHTTLLKGLGCADCVKTLIPHYRREIQNRIGGDEQELMFQNLVRFKKIGNGSVCFSV